MRETTGYSCHFCVEINQHHLAVINNNEFLEWPGWLEPSSSRVGVPRSTRTVQLERKMGEFDDEWIAADAQEPSFNYDLLNYDPTTLHATQLRASANPQFRRRCLIRSALRKSNKKSSFSIEKGLTGPVLETPRSDIWIKSPKRISVVHLSHFFFGKWNEFLVKLIQSTWLSAFIGDTTYTCKRFLSV